jgi:hypothetical protein
MSLHCNPLTLLKWHCCMDISRLSLCHIGHHTTVTHSADIPHTLRRNERMLQTIVVRQNKSTVQTGCKKKMVHQIHQKQRRNGSRFGPLATVKRNYEKSRTGAIQLHHNSEYHENTLLLLSNTVLVMQLSITEMYMHSSLDGRINCINNSSWRFLLISRHSEMWHRKTQQRVISQSRAVTNFSVKSGFYSKPDVLSLSENTDRSTGISNKQLWSSPFTNSQ